MASTLPMPDGAERARAVAPPRPLAGWLVIEPRVTPNKSLDQRTRRTIFIANLHSTITTAELQRHVEVATGMRPSDVKLGYKSKLARYGIKSHRKPRHRLADGGAGGASS